MEYVSCVRFVLVHVRDNDWETAASPRPKDADQKQHEDTPTESNEPCTLDRRDTPQFFVENSRCLSQHSRVGKLRKLLEKVGDVPRFNLWTAGRLYEAARKVRLSWKEKEEDHAVELLAEAVCKRLGCRVFDLLGILLDSDLNRDSTLAIAEVGGRMVWLVGIEVYELPTEKGIEQPSDHRLDDVIGVSETRARPRFRNPGQLVESIRYARRVFKPRKRHESRWWEQVARSTALKLCKWAAKVSITQKRLSWIDLHVAQHYVPRSYQQRFCSVDANGKPGVWVYDKLGQDPTPAFRHVQHTLAERDLYTLETAHPQGLSLEQQFSVLEGRANRILGRLDQGDAPEGNRDFKDLMLFISVSHFRVPRTIDHARELLTGLVGHQIRDFARNDDRLERFVREYKTPKGSSISADSIRKDAESFEDNFRVDRESALAQSLGMIDTTAAELGRFSWGILRVESPLFITSDSPVCCFVQKENDTAIFGGGFGLPGVQITLPISPKTCLFGDRLGASGLAPTTINRRTALNAHRYVVAQAPSPDIDALVRRARHAKYRATIDRSEVAALHEEGKKHAAAESESE